MGHSLKSNMNHMRATQCCLVDRGECTAALLQGVPVLRGLRLMYTQTLQKAPETTFLVLGRVQEQTAPYPRSSVTSEAKREQSLVSTIHGSPPPNEGCPPGKEAAQLHATDQRAFPTSPWCPESMQSPELLCVWSSACCPAPASQDHSTVQPVDPGKKADVAGSSLFILKNEAKSHHGCQAAQGARIFICVLVVLPGMFPPFLASPEMSLPQGALF